MRPALAVTAVGLALAVGLPVGWQLADDPESAGAPIAQALAAPRGPEAAGSAPATTGTPVGIRDATPTPPASVPVPVGLAIPARGVSAAVDPVGVSGDGQMALPRDVSRVGWYRFGPTPGAAGSAVIAGHVDDVEQGLGALAPLRAIEPGEEVVVTDAAGGITRWRVVARELVVKAELPLAEIFGRDGPPRLVLITCGGPFLPEFGSYQDNVVVVAEPVR